MKYYSLNAIEKLIAAYMDCGGHVTEVEPGVLGYGITVCYGDGLYTTIIREVYVNSWNSTHTIRRYKNMPQKYADMLERGGADYVRWVAR